MDMDSGDVYDRTLDHDISDFEEFIWNVPSEHIAIDGEHSDIDEEDDMANLLNNDLISEDDSEEEDDDHNNGDNFNKRRRLNSRGKFAKPISQVQFNKPTKVIKCKQSKRIRAMAFNPKRNEIAAISMNAAFHYFDIQRFEQVCVLK